MSAQMLQSLLAKSNEPTMSAQASEPIVIHGTYVLDGTEESGDIIEMVPLPAGYVPVDLLVDNADLGTTATADVGLMSGDYRVVDDARTCGAEFATGKALGTIGITRADVAGFTRIAPTDNDRSIGIKLTTVSSGTVDAKVSVSLTCRPNVNGA